MSTSFLTGQRQAAIRERLASDGRVIAATMAREFKVSEDTIRRDLREMAAAGLCERVYGGALPLAPSGAPLASRQAEAGPAKAELARVAAGILPRDGTIFIDAGSTNIALARQIAPDLRATIVTNSPAVALAVPEAPGLRVVLVGGQFDAHTGACLGAKAVSDAERLCPDLVVLGACGVDPVEGVTAFSQEEAEFKRRMALSGRSVMVIATADKLGTVAPFRVIAASQMTRMVTEDDVEPAILAAFADGGTDVVRVSVR
ncbi:DeoR/GlpR family DNA-binding transcription regulator [Aurantimonas coralicida]|uniref:DeoR/GlpR family DNA-binding transcription regulator n=1 Tax=Aurantimonas coralicida TaxID=182270 RepID=UPI00238E4C6A|nr:DeoR/GlpR family DNA-binding transcription regulator [Aurantimonas coralicida]MDE0921572.1 DeoR/GlpR family DNA-binding transcription regulator [Aurantimonas coralicida]